MKVSELLEMLDSINTEQDLDIFINIRCNDESFVATSVELKETQYEGGDIERKLTINAYE